MSNTEGTKRKIEVMQAYVDGKPIEVRNLVRKNWNSTNDPAWIWGNCNYRIAETPDTINWDHVAPEFKYMARDKDGACYLSKTKPVLRLDFNYWETGCSSEGAQAFASYKRGTVDWQDSLVVRPE